MDRKHCGTLGCLTCHVTATSQLVREINKFPVAYVILFKRVNFRKYFVCLYKCMQHINVINFKLNFAIEYSSGYCTDAIFPFLLDCDVFAVVRKAWFCLY